MSEKKLILPEDYQDNQLIDWHEGKTPLGLGIGCDLDHHLRYKQGQFNLTIGVDNVGKTFFKAWYYTALAKNQGKTFCIYSTENDVWDLKESIMCFYAGKDTRNMSTKEFYQTKTWVEGHFSFIDDRGFYTMEQLLNEFSNVKRDCFLIDPHNALDIPDNIPPYIYDKKSLGYCRKFTKQTKKTLEINGHCVSKASRAIHSDGEFKGLVMPPIKADFDGGQIFPNRADDFTIIHRYFKEPWSSTTMVFVDKIKSTKTGGKRTNQGEPVMMDYSNNAFYINGINPISGEFRVSDRVLSPIAGMEGIVPEGEKDESEPF